MGMVIPKLYREEHQIGRGHTAVFFLPLPVPPTITSSQKHLQVDLSEVKEEKKKQANS